MSAWPQAIWLAKRLQKNFDFSGSINAYVAGLNNLNQTVNNLNAALKTNEENLQVNIEAIKNKSLTFVSPEEPVVDTKTTGMIWFQTMEV